MVTKSITVDGIKIDLPKEMQVSGGQFEISKEGYDPVIIDLDKSSEASTAGKIVRAFTLGATGGLGFTLQATLINKIRSIGTFTTVQDMENQVVHKCRAALKDNAPAKMADVREFFKYNGYMVSGKGLTGFLSALYTADEGTKHEKMFEGSDFKLTEKNGLVIGMAKMKFLGNTLDASGLFDEQLVLINTFTKNEKGQIKPVKVGRCYLKGRNKNLGTAK